jgi:hypothetical protein
MDVVNEQTGILYNKWGRKLLLAVAESVSDNFLERISLELWVGCVDLDDLQPELMSLGLQLRHLPGVLRDEIERLHYAREIPLSAPS